MTRSEAARTAFDAIQPELLAALAAVRAREQALAQFNHAGLAAHRPAFAAIIIGLASSGTIALNFSSKVFLFAGAAAYGISLAFFMMRNFKWTHSIFHIFAIGAAVLVFFGIYNLI